MPNIDVEVNTGNINSEVDTPQINGNIGRSSVIWENDYNALINKPQINDVELSGNKTFDDLGLSALTSLEIIEIYRRIINNAE